MTQIYAVTWRVLVTADSEAEALKAAGGTYQEMAYAVSELPNVEVTPYGEPKPRQHAEQVEG